MTATFISNEPKRTLPHREPFLWVDRLISRQEDGLAGVVELDVTAEMEVFKGHFPGFAVFPGVLQIEAGAQACLWAHLGVLPEGAPLPEVLFVSVDSYRFRKPVQPPCTLQFRVKEIKRRAGLRSWESAVYVGETLVSQGSFLLKMT